MATLHVRNVPETIYERLRQRAQQQNRSLSAEVLILLENALDESQLNQTEVLSGIRQRRFFKPDGVNAPNSTELLRSDRNR